MDNNELLREVKQFVADSLHIPISNLTPETRLLHDLGIDGDDAIEFLSQYCKEFDVDLSTMNFDSYFGPEAGFNPIYYLFNKLFCKKKLKKTSLTINNLVRAAEKKEW